MDSIKKKMEKLSNETADAESRIAHFEEIKAQNEAEADKFEEQVTDQEYTSEILDWVFQKRQVRNIQKKMQAMESAFDVCTEDLFNQVRGHLVQYCLFKDKSNVGQVHFLAWLGICLPFHVVSSWAVISLLSLSYPWIWSLSIQDIVP